MARIAVRMARTAARMARTAARMARTAARMAACRQPFVAGASAGSACLISIGS